jgi:hypothetical protein
MDNEIELISDGDGLAIIGNPTAVDRFLATAGVPSKDLPSRDSDPFSALAPASHRQVRELRRTPVAG